MLLIAWDGRVIAPLPLAPQPLPWPPPQARGSCAAQPAIARLQRAFAGLTEYRGKADSFWSWRNLMYRFAARITPGSLEAIATWLYVEMLEAGYTSVCEFHYVHHDQGGTPYADDATLSLALLRAAQRAGIGITLPVMYQTSGFGAKPPRADQARFICSTDNMLSLLERLAPAAQAQRAVLGLAPHSLRAGKPPDSLAAARAGPHGTQCAGAHPHPYCRADAGRWMTACAWSGQRPVRGCWSTPRGRALVPGACHAYAGRSTRTQRAQAPWRHLPHHRNQPGRRHLRHAAVAAARWRAGRGLGQPCLRERGMNC